MKKTNILVFDGQTEQLLTQLSNKDNDQCPFYSPEIVEQLNKDYTFEFSVPADHEDAKLLVTGNIVGIHDLDNELQLFQIYKTEEEHTGETLQIRVYSEHLMYEMKDDIVEDRRVIDGDAVEAVDKALENSNFERGQVDDIGRGTVNYYYSDALSNLVKMIDRFKAGEWRFRFEHDGQKITRKLVDILVRRGADTGKRFEFTKDLKSVKRTVQTDGLKTALYGLGKGEEIEETGGYTRKPTFENVVWRTIDGDPVDKPQGQKWVGLPDAMEKFGRNGGTKHRFGVFNVDSSDPEEILQLTYEQLLEVSVPKVSYELEAITLEHLVGYEHEKVRLGDTVYVIDRELGLTIEARVLEIKWNPLNPEDTEIVLGNFIDDITDYNSRIEEIEAKITDRQGVWDSQTEISVVDDSHIVDIVPEVPTNISAVGLFKSILLKWSFDPSIAVSAYEVYGSQVKGFTPDSSNLLFRGKTGGFTHNANTNQTWYFRIRAVNPHGKASAFSQEFSASTLQLEQPDFENLTVYDAMIHDVSADKLTAGTIDANEVNIVNLNADNITAGKIKGQFLEINNQTVFAEGYDPSKKATPSDVQSARQHAEEYANQIRDSIIDYTAPVMNEVYDTGFLHGKEYWSDSPTGQFTDPTTKGTLVESDEAEFGTHVLQLTGETSLYSRNAIPVNPNRVYLVAFRVRQLTDPTNAQSKVSAGVVNLDGNFTELIGATVGSKSFVIKDEEINVDRNWQLFTGFITTEGEDDLAGEDGSAQFRIGTKFVRPFFTVNGDGGDGTVQVDFVQFIDVTEVQSLEQRVSDVEFAVSRENIWMAVSSSTEYQDFISSVPTTEYVEENFATLDDLDETAQMINEQLENKADLDYLDRTYATKTELNITAENLDFKFSSSGGVNLLRNSVGYAGTDFWDVDLDKDPNTDIVVGTVDAIQNAELVEHGAGSGFVLNGAKLTQTISTVSQFYTISTKVKKGTTGHGYLRVYYDDTFKEIQFNEGTEYFYTQEQIIIEPVGNEITIEIYGTGDVLFTSTMVNVGNVALQWQHSAGEVYNTNVLVDMNGIRVITSEYEGYTAITPEEFAGYAEVDGQMEKVFTLNRDVTEVAKLEASKEIRMSPIKVIPINSGGFSGWAFVPD